MSYFKYLRVYFIGPKAPFMQQGSHSTPFIYYHALADAWRASQHYNTNKIEELKNSHLIKALYR